MSRKELRIGWYHQMIPVCKLNAELMTCGADTKEPRGHTQKQAQFSGAASQGPGTARNKQFTSQHPTIIFYIPATTVGASEENQTEPRDQFID